MQPHLRKCFDAIAKLEFGTYDEEDVDENAPVMTTDIVAMLSPEGEKVHLGKVCIELEGICYNQIEFIVVKYKFLKHFCTILYD